MLIEVQYFYADCIQNDSVHKMTNSIRINGLLDKCKNWYSHPVNLLMMVRLHLIQNRLRFCMVGELSLVPSNLLAGISKINNRLGSND